MYFWTAAVLPRALVGVFCVILLYVLSQTIFKVPIEAYETNAYRRVAKGLRNPRRVRDALLRISFLTLSLVLLYPLAILYSIPIASISIQIRERLPLILLTYSLIVLTTVVLYLLACDPLPPSPSKLREWLRGAAPARLTESESRK
jgi:sterol desaturase/sphingolipid hydroxylase (fatty acid hydroxylase superfamily)